DTAELAGVTSGGFQRAPAVPVTALDALPIPDYDDYFANRAAILGEGRRLLERRDLPFESSRGCWWGQKSHCTFCGLNNEGMAYRMKSVDRVIDEVTALSTRYQCVDLEAADNILPYPAYQSLLPRLAGLGLDLRFMYEIKANIGRDDAAALRAAGIRWVQPGVESFSDHVLELMRKGSTGALNIQLIKWLQEFGVTPYYNLLVGFPGETPEDYEEVIALLPALYHLTPPIRSRTVLVSVHRFAPFFNESERWGIQGRRPAWYYRHLIPPSRAPAEDFAFFFDRDIPADAPVLTWRPRLDAALARWATARHKLKASLGPGFISVLRVQGRKEVEIASLREAAACVFLLCDAATTLAKLERELAALRPGSGVDLAAVVADLLERRLVIRCGERLVGVVPFERPHAARELSDWLERWGRRPARAEQPLPRRLHLRGGAVA
ncbi:MAG TPA: RiPP maturation radical SAM C-methyltransferase, partial [Gemmatimonadales bacterium]|nr:RiPP maturation radical SAM C-methyltransferase [Gemmatimonadales bacterium]